MQVPPDSADSCSDSANTGIGAAARVVLRARKAQPFYGRHPWLLATAIDRVEGEPADGSEVDLLSDHGRWIARGIYNSKSRIRVRLYRWEPGSTLDREFWRQRLETAVDLRRCLRLLASSEACRLVFSEADGLSGLIVDRYGRTLVAQINALAIGIRLPMITELLCEMLEPQAIVVRGEAGVGRLEGFDFQDGVAWGELPARPLAFREHGLEFQVDPLEGHKTGYYLDQRENRLAAARYLAGRRVLDMFCYTGAFALAARALGQAAEVVAYDSSARAIELARQHAERNGIDAVRFEVGEAFETLDSLRGQGERFGAVILDPPKFAGQRKHVEQALRAYHRLNRLAVELLEPSGILVTCCCSGHVSRDDFLYMLVGVGQQTGRAVQILEQRGAAADHPVAAHCLETQYLKCFVCRVV